MNEKKLADSCYTCKSEEIFEEVYNWKGQELTLSICPVCRLLNDWELPDNLQDFGAEDQEEFDELSEYAKNEAKKKLIKKGLWFHVHVSRFAEERLGEELLTNLKSRVLELMCVLNTQDCYIGISGMGIKIQVV